jgi:hypothetical protein
VSTNILNSWNNNSDVSILFIPIQGDYYITLTDISKLLFFLKEKTLDGQTAEDQATQAQATQAQPTQVQPTQGQPTQVQPIQYNDEIGDMLDDFFKENTRSVLKRQVLENFNISNYREDLRSVLPKSNRAYADRVVKTYTLTPQDQLIIDFCLEKKSLCVHDEASTKKNQSITIYKCSILFDRLFTTDNDKTVLQDRFLKIFPKKKHL